MHVEHEKLTESLSKLTSDYRYNREVSYGSNSRN